MAKGEPKRGFAASRPASRAATLVALVVSVLAAAGPVTAGTLVQNVTLPHGGITRYFDYYVPDGLPAAPVPLLFVLHGGTQSNKLLGLTASVEFAAIADEERFVVIYPNGTNPTTGLSGPSGSFNWNDCRADAGSSTTTADDVGFIGALIDWAAATFEIDLDRVYATGASNGGLMSYRLAFEGSDRIAAIGAVVANLPANSECPATPARPVGVLVMNGTADPFMPFDGGTILGNTGVVQSTAATRDFWRAFLAPSPTPTHVDVPDVDPSDASAVSVDAYCHGAQGAAVALYTVFGGGHTMPSIAHPVPPSFAFLGPQNRDLEGARVIWRFTRRHRRTGCGPCEAWDASTQACAAVPRTGCRRSTAPPRTIFRVRDRTGLERDRVAWKWTRGEATGIEDLGDPLAESDAALCVYDESGNVPRLVFRTVAPGGESLCGTSSRWRKVGNGYRYRDTTRIPDGVFTVRLGASASSNAKVSYAATGSNLAGRSFGMPAPPLVLPLRVQLHVQGGMCFEARYSAGGVLANAPGRFKGRAEP